MTANSSTTCDFSNPTMIGAPPVQTIQYASSSCATTFNFPTSTLPAISGGFTFGEILISLFAFIIMVQLAYIHIWLWLRGIKIKQRGI